MKVLVDVGVGIAVEEQLRELGHDVLAVRDLNPSMPDSEILTRALAEERLVITMDKDFGELVYGRGQLHSGVLLLRRQSVRRALRERLGGLLEDDHRGAA